MQGQRYLMIAVTGLVAMIAQMVWYRYASQVLGQSSLTVAAVVASALLGLSAGNGWGGKYARLSASSCLAGLGISVLLSQVFFYSLATIEPLVKTTNVAWAIVVVAPLSVINFFAGAVFPRLLSREKNSSIVGRLSAAETIGGCVGAIFTGCFAMQNFGLMPTLVGGGLLALAIGVLAKKEMQESTDRSAGSVAPAGSVDPPAENGPVELAILAAVCVSGIASLGMEVVWQRLLILIVGTDTFSYAVVVTSYLMGIAAGAAISSVWLRLRPSVPPMRRLKTVAILQVSAAITSLIVLMAVIFLASGAGQEWINDKMIGYDAPLLKRLLLCAGVLLVPTALQGALFPLVVDAVANKQLTLNAPAGKIYGLLAVGNVFGILVCGFFLIPLLGLQVSLTILAVVSTIAAWLFTPKKISNTLFGLTMVMFALCGHRLLFKDTIGLAINPEQTSKFYYREGPAHTVAVLADKTNLHHRRMTVDGIVIGQSGHNAEEKQLILAHLPALLNYKTHPIENVAVIGLGSGLLSGEIAAVAGVKSVNTIELSPSVIEASAYFTDLWPVNRVAKTTVTQADGIHWLGGGGDDSPPLDAIISDGKSRPGHIGNAAFFSSDYYLRAANRLRPHGKFVQWYSLDAAVPETRTVLRTFAKSFPYTRVAIAAPDSIYLVGSRVPIEMETKNAAAYLKLDTSKSLHRYHWRTVDDLRSMAWLPLAPLPAPIESGDINTLNRPVLEQFSFDFRPATLRQNKIENLKLLKELINSGHTSASLFTDDEVSGRATETAATDLIEAFIVVLRRESLWLDEAAAKLKPVIATLPKLHRGSLLSSSYLIAAELAATEGDAKKEISMLKRAGPLAPADYAMQIRVGQRLLRLGAAEDALPHFLNAIAAEPDSGTANKGAAMALIELQKLETAFPYFQKAAANPEIKLDADFLELEKLFQPSTPIAQPDQGQDLLDSMKKLLDEPSSAE